MDKPEKMSFQKIRKRGLHKTEKSFKHKSRKNIKNLKTSKMNKLIKRKVKESSLGLHNISFLNQRPFFIRHFLNSKPERIIKNISFGHYSQRRIKKKLPLEYHKNIETITMINAVLEALLYRQKLFLKGKLNKDDFVDETGMRSKYDCF